MEGICGNCKKKWEAHTQVEILNCKLALSKNVESEITEEEVTSHFNEIKSGEFSRMYEGQKNNKNSKK